MEPWQDELLRKEATKEDDEGTPKRKQGKRE